ncbi:MAG: hypothetical protein GX542_10255 [Rhodococcus sp.]|nr:hypothetical protein [Rhodococcus sp. (in: high G+C Gram-positive bacteria)]
MSQQTPSAQRPALIISVILMGAGVLHFLAPKFYDAIVPRSLPGEPRTYTYASGVAEFAIGTSLLVPRTRRLGGTAAAALFVAVFPANIKMAVDWIQNPKTTQVQKIGAIARLPLQIPLVVWALQVRNRTPKN